MGLRYYVAILGFFGEVVALSQSSTINLYFLFIEIHEHKNINNNIKESTRFKAHTEGNESFLIKY